MTRLMGVCAAAIFLLGMLTAQLVGPLDPAVAKSKVVETISPEEITKRVTGLKDETVLDAM
jgi:hypothetical protein